MSTGFARRKLVAVVVSQPLDIARERRRVAADVDDPRRADLAEPLQRLPGEARTRRVDDDDVRISASLVQILDRLADVAGEERGVADAVQVGVLERARDRLLRNVDPPDGQRVAASTRPIVPIPQ